MSGPAPCARDRSEPDKAPAFQESPTSRGNRQAIIAQLVGVIMEGGTGNRGYQVTQNPEEDMAGAGTGRWKEHEPGCQALPPVANPRIL